MVLKSCAMWIYKFTLNKTLTENFEDPLCDAEHWYSSSQLEYHALCFKNIYVRNATGKSLLIILGRKPKFFKDQETRT